MQDSLQNNRSVAYKMLFIEAVITVVVALMLGLGVNVEIATSVFIGGLAFIIPNAYFTKYVFRYSAADSPGLAVRGFYLGEAVKIVATVVIFTCGFLFIEKLNVPALILTYISMLILNLWGNSIFISSLAEKAGKMENKNNGD